MITSFVLRLRLSATVAVLSLVTAGLIAGCAKTEGLGGWFPDARRYQGECIPPQEDEGGCWWFAFTPTGRVDFTSGGDIAYSGEYRIRGSQISVIARQHSDLELGLSADQDTLRLPHGTFILRIK